MSKAQPGQVRAVIYARISNDREGAGEGVARQIEACEERAAREGWTLVGDPLRDDSLSAWRSGVTRPAYQQLLRLVRERQVDVVLVWHMSRLWRGRVERATGIDVFKDAGVKLAVVQGSEIDFSTAMGRGMVGMLGEVDTMESDLKSERIVAQKASAAEAGKFRGGRRPFGFEDDGVTIRPKEATVIQQATHDVLAGRSLLAVARELNERGVVTSTGGQWNHQKLKRVLLRPRNAGMISTGNSEDYNVTIVGKASWEPIVDLEEYEALNRMLTDASRRRKAGWSHLKWFGSGIYVCGRCGGRMRSSSIHTAKRKMSTYRCADFSHVVIMASKTDDFVRDTIVNVVRDPRIIKALTAGESDVMQADRARRELLQTRLDQTDADYDEDLIDARRYKAKRDKLMAELSEIEDRLSAGVEQSTISPIFAGRDPGQAFLDAPLDVQRAVFRSVLKVTIKPNERRGAAWSSERLVIEPVHQLEGSA